MFGLSVRTCRGILTAARLDGRDLILGLATIVALGLQGLLVLGLEPVTPVAVALAVVIGIGVGGRRRWPVATGVVIAVAVVAHGRLPGIGDAVTVSLAPLLLAFFTMGAHGSVGRGVLGFVLAYTVVGLDAAAGAVSTAGAIENAVFVAVIAGAVFLGGIAVRINRERAAVLADLASQLEREREDRIRLSIVAERLRIARELHDIVAHGLSIIAVQAGAGRHTLGSDPERTPAALEAIESTARRSLAEMRSLLGLLRDADSAVTASPTPTLAQHGDLVAEARASGLAVEVEIAGQVRSLPPGIDLTAYRVIQEALTNARKYAPGGSATVSIRYGTTDLEVEVRDDGPSSAPPATPSSGGLGLIGMRERVLMYSGELDAGPDPGGGFRVFARLPTEEGAS